MDIKYLLKDITETIEKVSFSSRESTEKELNQAVALCKSIQEPKEKKKVVERIADGYYALAEKCSNGLDIFGSLNCVLNCRRLYEMLPSDPYIASQFLQCLTGLSYVKNEQQERGMVEEFLDEAFELSDRFPKDASVQLQTAICVQNLIALCGSYEAPVSLAFSAADKMEELSDRYPQDSDIQNVFAHILISALYFARQKEDHEKYRHFASLLNALGRSRGKVLDQMAIRMHLRRIGLA